MSPATAARLLDLTRLVSRLGRGQHTGVDRVEYAYLDHLLHIDRPLFGLVRTSVGFLLLDRAGCAGIAALVRGDTPLPPADMIGRVLFRRNPMRGRAEAAARRLSVARAARPFLAHMLRNLPAGSTYLNLGHANLTASCLQQLRSTGLRLAVMVHDTIPLDHPEYARAGTVDAFHGKLAVVSRFADLVIHTTHDARAKTEIHLARRGRVPTGIVANLGVPRPVPNAADLPRDLQLTPPYFVALGTIEPRKNHGLLLDIWDHFGTGPDAPRLYIIGGRGWANPDVFARLDALPADHPIKWLQNLPDSGVTALLSGAMALLFPSRAEGFGLPAVEAAALGVPVITSNLPVIKELLGDFAVYLDVTDIYSWIETIKTHTNAVHRGKTANTRQQDRIDPPKWSDHFKIVLRDL